MKIRYLLAFLAIFAFPVSPSHAAGALLLAAPVASGCTAATNYLARATGEVTHVADMTTLICGLVTDGVITGNLSGAAGCGTKLDVLYIDAQQTQADALLNLCGTNFSGTNSSATFTAFQGFSATGVQFVDTNFNASTATTPNYTQNSASYGVWSYAVVNEPYPVMGTSANATAGESNIYTDYTGTDFYGRINSSTGGASSVPAPGSKGVFSTERTSSSSTTLYWDGVSQGTVTDTSAAPDNFSFRILTIPAAPSFSTQTISAHFAGASLGATLELALYTRLRTYMTAVGVP